MIKYWFRPNWIFHSIGYLRIALKKFFGTLEKCKGHQKENRECFKEDCSDEDILAFLDLKENFQKNMETWRSSLNRHPLNVVFKNGSREYMAEMNLKEKMSLTFKKIRNFLKNPKKRILEMKRLFYGQKPVLQYSLIGIICLVIMLVMLKIVSCCWKAETSKNGYRKLANIDIENWNISSIFEYKDNKICTEIIEWLFFFSRSQDLKRRIKIY